MTTPKGASGVHGCSSLLWPSTDCVGVVCAYSNSRKQRNCPKKRVLAVEVW